MDRTKMLILLVVILSSLVIIGEKATLKFEEIPLEKDELLRLHIVANSNSFQDQELKREVKKSIKEEITEVLGEVKSYEQAKAKLDKNLALLKSRLKARHDKLNSDYQIDLALKSKDFPTRSYGGLSLAAGQYQTLEVELGRAQGSNWWCVLFPPFCIVDLEKEDIELATEKKETLLSEEENKEVEYRFKLVDKLVESGLFNDDNFSLPFQED